MQPLQQPGQMGMGPGGIPGGMPGGKCNTGYLFISLTKISLCDLTHSYVWHISFLCCLCIFATFILMVSIIYPRSRRWAGKRCTRLSVCLSVCVYFSTPVCGYVRVSCVPVYLSSTDNSLSLDSFIFYSLFFSISFSLTGAVPPAQTTGMPPQGINPPPSHGAMGGEYRRMKCVGVHSLRCPCVPTSPRDVHLLFSFITLVHYLGLLPLCGRMALLGAA